MRGLWRGMQGGLGLALGLAAAEGAFWLRDEGAFPHVNFYVADPELGVRLQAGAQERIAFGGNAPTTIGTHSLGYRAPAWPAPGADEIVVVGDSQVFGLGVEADQTLAAHLARETGRTVLNGGVPTYGPDEYLAAAEEIILLRGGAVKDLVVVLNFSNDLFEVARPNRERHAVWDGWAVRIETAPAEVAWFPGRSWLMSRSHAVFALRRWLHTPLSEGGQGLPSEGTMTDVVATAQAVHQTRQAAGEAVAVQRRTQAQAYAQAAQKVYEEDDLLEMLDSMGYLNETVADDVVAVRAVMGRVSAGDIVDVGYGEASRPVEVTAEMLRRGAQIRRNLRAYVERQLAATSAPAEVRAQMPQAQALPEGLATETLQAVLWGTPFDAILDRAVALGDAHGAEVTIVTLPLDVQVLESQWAKYGVPPQDMRGSEVLLDDVAEAARQRGMRTANPLSALRAVGDPAFLQGDLHLTSAGHAAVAGQVAAALTLPLLRPPDPAAGLPSGRSRVPLVEEFLAAGEISVRGSTRNRCGTYIVREWFYLDCRAAPGDALAGIHLRSAPLETFATLRPERLELWMPLLDQRSAEVDVLWEGRQEQLQLFWSRTDLDTPFTPTLLFDAEALPERPTPDAGTLLWENHWVLGATEGCLLNPQPQASQRASSACLLGSREALLPCPPGKANAGSAGHCLPLCSPDVPCARGVCSDWSGGRICL